MHARSAALYLILLLFMIASPVSSSNMVHSGSQISFHGSMGKETANISLHQSSATLQVSATNSSNFPESFGQKLSRNSSVPSQYAYSGNSIQPNYTLNIIGDTIFHGIPNGTAFYDPVGSVFDPFNNMTYLSDPYSLYILALTPKGSITNIPAFGGITGIAYDSANHLVYVTSRVNGLVAAIGNASVEFTMNVSVSGYGGPNELCYDPLSNLVYAAALNKMFLIQDSYVVGNFSSDIRPGTSALFDPANGYIYMDSQNSIVVFCGTQSIGNITIHGAGNNTPSQMTYNDAAGEVYVTVHGSPSIWVLRNMTLIKIISFSNEPAGYYGQPEAISGISYNEWNGRTYLVYSQRVLNKSSPYWFNTGNLLNHVDVNMRSAGELSYNSLTHTVDIPVIISSVPALLVINGGALSETLGLGTDMTSTAYDTSDSTLYIANAFNNTLILVKNDHIISYVSSGGVFPEKLLYDPVNGYMYVLNNGSSSVVVMSHFGIKCSIRVGSDPADMTLNESSGIIYVANSGSGNITVISGIRSTGSIEFGATPGPMCYDASDGFLYVAVNSMELISIVSGSRIVQNLSMQHFFDITSMAYDSGNGLVYIGQNGGNYGSMLQIYSGRTLVKTVSKANGALFYDNGNGIVYTQSHNGSMEAMSGLNSTPSMNAISGAGPLPGSFNTVNGTLYVAGGSAGTVSIFEGMLLPDHSVYLNETGLPAGTEWNLSIFGIRMHTSGTWIEDNLTDGYYEYTIPIVTVGGKGYEATSVTGNFTVNKTGLSVAVAFRKVSLFPVTITEKGLPQGSLWSVATSLGQSYSTNLTEIMMHEPNGTISFKAHGPSNTWKTMPGSFTVNGSDSNSSVSFSEYENYIIFLWQYEVSSFPYVKYYFNISGQSPIVYSNGNSLKSLIIPNGTYRYTFTASGKIARGFITSLQWADPEYQAQQAERSASPQSESTFTVEGFGTELGAGNVVATGLIQLLDTKLVFTETGLPPGTSWYLNFAPNYNLSWIPVRGNNQLNRTTSYTSLAPVLELNGSYTYYAGVVSQTAFNGQIIAQPGGFNHIIRTFIVSSFFVFENYSYNVPVQDVSVVFERISFNISIFETGLKEGAYWIFSINGKSYSAGTGTTELEMKFGYYNLSASAPADYYVSNAPSRIFVNRTMEVIVHFQEYAYITGSTLSSANITINGIGVNFTGNYFSMREKTGNYSVKIEEQNITYVKNVTLAPGQVVFLNYSKEASSNINRGLSFNLPNLVLSITSGVEAAAIVFLFVKREQRKRK